jgi:endonuclease G
MRKSIAVFAALAAIYSPLIVAQEIHSKHCLKGCPVGGDASNDLLIRDIYILSSNDQTKLADWAAYKVTSETIGKSHKRNWRADPWLDDDETLEPNDYKGANQALKTDRGHVVPLASFSATTEWAATNYMSNITPQASALNQGPWKNLEGRVREMAKVDGADGVFVMTGPLFEGYSDGLPMADEVMALPTAYWKIVAMEVGATPSLTAFIFPQTAGRKDDFCQYIVSLREVEVRTGLEFFHQGQARDRVIETPKLTSCNWSAGIE